jgi:hypothetical protein
VASQTVTGRDHVRHKRAGLQRTRVGWLVRAGGSFGVNAPTTSVSLRTDSKTAKDCAKRQRRLQREVAVRSRRIHTRIVRWI